MENSKEFIRLNTVRRVDPHVSVIIDSAVGTALYTYGESWSKTDVEGTLMLYRREAPPYNMLTIINRLNKSNFVEAISPSCEMQAKPPFLLLKSSKGVIYCIWFPEPKDVQRIYESIKMKISETFSTEQVPPTILNDPAIAVAGSVGDDIMSMLSKAHGEFEVKKQDGTGRGQKPIDDMLKPSPLRLGQNPVADFFAKVGSLNTLPGSGAPVHTAPTDSVSPNPMLQKIFQGAAAAGQPFSFASSTNNPTTSAPIQVPSTSSLTSNIAQSAPMSLQELEGRLKENLSFSHGKDDLLSSKDNGFNIHNQSDSLLLSPQVFTTNVNCSLFEPNKPLPTGGLNMKPFNGSKELLNDQPNLLSNFGITPLTHEQLVQAFTVLLKKKEFVSQLHQAYIEAIQQSLQGI